MLKKTNLLFLAGGKPQLDGHDAAVFERRALRVRIAA
jgi:hypothetical protein